VAAARADYAAQLDTVRQVQEMVGFERVVAPFDGVITDRQVDAGDLTMGNSSSGTSMFTLQRDEIVRVHVDVPQSAAIALEEGLEAQITSPEMPNQVFTGRVTRSAGALTVASRTLSAEIDLYNDAHTLRPGQFVYVTLAIPRTRAAVVIPANAILFNGGGLRVATVGTDHAVKMHDITIYRDFGTTVELQEGLAGDERVIVNPPANLENGSVVRIAAKQGSQEPAH
jgi:HlyD family secretion protein